MRTTQSAACDFGALVLAVHHVVPEYVTLHETTRTKQTFQESGIDFGCYEVHAKHALRNMFNFLDFSVLHFRGYYLLFTIIVVRRQHPYNLRLFQ